MKLSVLPLLCLAAAATTACGASPRAPASSTRPPDIVNTTEQIIARDQTGTEADLARKADAEIMGRKWREAAHDYEILVAASPRGPNVPSYLMGLATAYEGLDEREKARDKYREIAERFPKSADARAALVRASTIYAYLEDWKSLAEIGDMILGRTDIDNVDRIVGLGSRGLAKVELGDDMGASHDVLEGLDVVDKTHYSAANLVPVAAAQLRFALGEVRRIRSERIELVALTPDFPQKVDARCGGLLDAQQAYEQAVRSVDPHWATMAGYRMGQMYRRLHHDLITIPPPSTANEKDKKLFYAFMHIRFRNVLETGINDIRLTLQIAENIHDESQWVTRAREALKDMEMSLAEERTELAKLPYTEDEIRTALTRMAKSSASR